MSSFHIYVIIFYESNIWLFVLYESPWYHSNKNSCFSCFSCSQHGYIFFLFWEIPPDSFFTILFERPVRYVLGLYFLVSFWLSLCKIFFIYFLSCPIVTNYIVKKQKKSVASVVSGPSRDFLFWSMSWKRSSQSQARSNGQIMANLRERKIS